MDDTVTDSKKECRNLNIEGLVILIGTIIGLVLVVILTDIAPWMKTSLTLGTIGLLGLELLLNPLTRSVITGVAIATFLAFVGYMVYGFVYAFYGDFNSIW